MSKWLGYLLPLACGVLAIGCSEQEGSDVPQECDETFFRDETECVPVTICNEDEEEVAPPTATSDRVCQRIGGCTQEDFFDAEDGCVAYTVCATHEFEFIAPTATS